MTKTDVPNISRKFLKEVDGYLAKSWQSLRCLDIHGLYFEMFNGLKEFKGNSSGFTGLSELLIFRFLYHQLGGLFEPPRKVTQDLWEFVSESISSLRIRQSCPVTAGKKYYPDIAVCKADKLLAVIQIKLYLTNGLKEAKKEVEVLEDLQRSHPEMQALLFKKVKKSVPLSPTGKEC